MQISEIKKRLEAAKPDAKVYFDFCNCVPTHVSSWRGIYSEPSIGWGSTGYGGEAKAPTVKEFIDEINLATSGKVYFGWKGGDYTYSEDDELHVDNNGDCTNTEIVFVEVDDYQIILHTRHEE